MGLKDFFSRLQGGDQKQADSVEKKIEESGAIWQHRLWRRWVMGQMFHMLTWGKDKTLSEYNYDRRLSRFSVNMARKYALKEQKMQLLLEKNADLEELNERRRWFSKDVLDDILHRANSCLPESYKQAYKGTGAYFTMKNLIMFHGCCFVVDGKKLSSEESLSQLKSVNFNPSTSANELFALMMQLIESNDYIYSVD